MLYLWIAIEVGLTAFILFRRRKLFLEKKKRINPKGFSENAPEMKKTGKTKRLQRAREQYRNHMVLILAAGLSAISLTLFLNAGSIVNQHRKDGLIPCHPSSMNKIEVKNDFPSELS